MNRWLIIILIVATLGLAVSVTGLVAIWRRMRITEAPALVQDSRYEGLEIPVFRLTDQDGRTVDEHILDGRFTVVDFIFTNCPYACPMMTLAMHEVTKALIHTPVHYLSITVDPAHDTPEALKQYAESRGIVLDGGWVFLTGDMQTIRHIVFDSLKFALDVDASRPVKLPDGQTMPNIVHPTKLILIGPDRKVVGIYNSDDPDDRAALIRTAREASSHARR